MRKLSTFLLAMLVAGLVACKKDDDNPGNNGNGNDNGSLTVLTGEITSDLSLDAGKKYLLTGNVFVTNGATITIPAGTVIFGDKLSKGALIITKGSKINAVGTPDKPIVFTSNAPEGFRNRGDWAGVVLLGEARNNRGAGQDIEGISGGNANGKHGGEKENDNSGVMQYVRIEFAGIALSPDNELNSLTMGSVGKGTVTDHILVSYAGDDAFEWFGGNVDGNHLIAYNTLDDDFDTDMGYTGTVNYGIVVRDPGSADVSGSNGFESDNNSSQPELQPITAPVFNYFTVIGPYAFKSKDIDANYQHGGHLRRGSNIVIKNSLIVGWPTGINFDKPGQGVMVENTAIAKNNAVVSSVYVKGDAPAGASIIEVDDMNSLFTNTGWKNLENPDLSAVAETYRDKGAFAGSPNWNWNSGWVNFDPIYTKY